MKRIIVHQQIRIEAVFGTVDVEDDALLTEIRSVKGLPPVRWVSEELSEESLLKALRFLESKALELAQQRERANATSVSGS